MRSARNRAVPGTARQARRSADEATRQRGNEATRQRGNEATRQRGNEATRQRGNEATRQRGNEAGSHKEVRRRARVTGMRLVHQHSFYDEGRRRLGHELLCQHPSRCQARLPAGRAGRDGRVLRRSARTCRDQRHVGWRIGKHPAGRRPASTPEGHRARVRHAPRRARFRDVRSRAPVYRPGARTQGFRQPAHRPAILHKRRARSQPAGLPGSRNGNEEDRHRAGACRHRRHRHARGLGHGGAKRGEPAENPARSASIIGETVCIGSCFARPHACFQQ